MIITVNLTSYKMKSSTVIWFALFIVTHYNSIRDNANLMMICSILVKLTPERTKVNHIIKGTAEEGCVWHPTFHHSWYAVIVDK